MAWPFETDPLGVGDGDAIVERMPRYAEQPADTLEFAQDFSEMSKYSLLKARGQLQAFREALPPAQVAALAFDDRFWLRPKQIISVNDIHDVIVMMAGRGWGKTRAGSSWIRQQLFVEGCKHAALVARTHSEAVGIVLKEDSGIMNTFPPDLMPHWNSQTRELTWPNHGKKATVLYGNEPEQARGYNFDCAWIDEFAKFRDPAELWDLLWAALRLKRADGKQPPALFTTTPVPDPTLQEFVNWHKKWLEDPAAAAADETPRVKLIAGSTHDNRDNLGPNTIRNLTARYKKGSRKYRQEVLGELLLDIEGAIFKRKMFTSFMPVIETEQDGFLTKNDGIDLKAKGYTLDKDGFVRDEAGEKIPRYVPVLNAEGVQTIKWDSTLDLFSRIVVGVDPSGARDPHSSADSIGIIVAGLLTGSNTAVVLADETMKDAPAKWGRKVVSLYRKFRANQVVGEENFGGGMVEAAIKAASPNEKIPYLDLHASRGKDQRAEEIAGFYDDGRVKHLYHIDADKRPVLGDLEDQMCNMTVKEYKGPERSPDRADAAIWALRCLLRSPERKKTYGAFRRNRNRKRLPS